MFDFLFGFVERVKRVLLRFYRLHVFQWYTGQKTDHVTILGPMMLFNKNVRVGKHVTFYPNVMLWGDGIIQIGDNVDIGTNTIIYSRRDGGVFIGDETHIAADCYIIDSNHGFEKGKLISAQPMTSEKIVIGDDVWIGASCQIIKGAGIGSGSVIGAGSLVNKKIPEDVIAFGIPAKISKKRI